MSTQELISVIVPVYNTSLYLRKCLDSLIGQSYNNLEIIVVNDGSTDNSPAICDEYAEKYPKQVKVYHTKNGGLSAARNAGIRNANGHYIGFVDSDDWCAPNMFECLYQLTTRENADVSSCGIVEDFGNEDANTPEHGYSYWISDSVETLLKNVLTNKNVYGYACNKLFHRDIFKTLSFDESLMSCEDLDFCVNVALNIKKAAHCSIPLYHYRQHNNSMTGISDYSPRKLSVIQAYENILPVYEKHAPSLIGEVRKNLLKIYINVLGRAKNSNVCDTDILNMLNKGISQYWSLVLKDSNVPITEKINIILSRLCPGTLLSIKQHVLKLKRK